MLNLQIKLISFQAYIAIAPSLNNNIYLKLGSHVTTNMDALLYIVNPLYNHAHFSHILVCITHFLITIYLSKKHHFLESLSHLLVAQKNCKAFLVNVFIMREI
jgi:hypothetical protein